MNLWRRPLSLPDLRRVGLIGLKPLQPRSPQKADPLSAGTSLGLACKESGQ
jgi:hypothetical protein